MKIPARILSTSGVLIFLLLMSSNSLLADPPKEERHTPHLPPPAPMGTVQVSSQVGQTTDDVLEDKGDGSQYVFTADMVLAEDGSDDKWNGMRFDGMNVPQGATIQSAYIQFGVSGSSSGTANLKIWGEMSTDAAEFLWTSYGVANRSKTSDSVAWSPPNWTTTGAQGTDQQTPDLSDLVQEIVDQSGWVSGNAMALFVEGTGTRWAHAYQGSSTLAPILYVTYQTTGTPPSAVASATPTSGTASLAVSFTGSNSTDDGSIASYAWDFGDSNSSSTADPSHTYTTTGSFSVSLIVTDNEGDKDTASLTIEVNSGVNPPTAVASATPTSGTAALAVSFTGSNSTDNGSITAYAWNFGDGNSSTNADPNHTYTTAGSFTAQLIVTDNQNNKDTATVAITVSSAGDDPIAVAAATPQNGTASLSVSFTGSNSTDDGSISAYAWDFGDSNSSSSADPSHSYTVAGLYVVQLIVTDNENNQDTTELIVGVDSGSGLTQLNSQPGQTTDDVLEDKGDGSQYVFTSELVMAQDGSDDKWNGMRFDGVNVPQGATIQSAYIQFTVSGTSSGTANLKIWGEMSTDADEFLWTSYDVTNRSKTTDSVAWSPPDWTTVGAQGADQQTPDLSDLIQEIVDQSGWVSGNAMALFVEGTGTRWAEAYEGSSTLSPKLYITYQNGVPPVAIASASPLTGIAPMTVSFTGSNSTDDGTISAYAWQFGDGKTSSSADPTHTYTKEGSYSAILSTIDNVGLVDRDTVAIQVSGPSSIVVVSTLTHASGISPNTGVIDLEVSGGTSPYSFSWTDGATGSYRNGLPPGAYTVTITDSLGTQTVESYNISNRVQWELVPSNYPGVIARGENMLGSNEDGWLEYEVSMFPDSSIFGFSPGDDPWHYFKQLGKYLYIVEFVDSTETFDPNTPNQNGATWILPFDSVEVGDKLRMTRQGDTVYYALNGVEIHKKFTYATSEVYPEGQYNGGTTNIDTALSKVSTSFGCDIFTIALSHSPGFEMTVDGGKYANYYLPAESVRTFFPENDTTQEIKLHLDGLEPDHILDVYFNIDAQARISNIEIRKDLDSDGQPDTAIALDQRFFTLEYDRYIRFRDVEQLINWSNLICVGTSSPAFHDPNRNWIYTIAYGDGGVLVEQTTYFDNLGRPIQTQLKNQSEQRILASESIYDAFGRPVLSTLPAPVGSQCYFQFDDNFITGPNGDHYDYTDFDAYDPLNPSASAPTNTLDNPYPVNTTSNLGNYYSDNNGEEAYVSTTQYPYSRVDNTLGGVSRSAGSGDVMHMGTGHETVGTSFTVLEELDHYISFRDDYVADGNTISSLKYKAIKSVGRDANGKETVSFTDLSGNPVASCISGEGGTPIPVTAEVDAFLKYIDIHIPIGMHTSFSFSNANTALTVKVFDLLTDEELHDNTIGTFSGFTTGGFYRIVQTDLVPEAVAMSYSLDYEHFSYNYFDKAGRLIAEVQPEGINLSQSSLTQVTSYWHHSWYLLESNSPDEGLTRFIYGRDGRLRFSQHAEQLANGARYAYTNYDEASGRIMEMGELSSPGLPFAGHQYAPPTGTVHDIVDLEDGLNGTRGDQTFVIYDLPDPTLTILLTTTPWLINHASEYEQTFLLGTASKTWNDNSTTWYSYDMLGRLRWTIQEIEGLGVFTMDYTYDFQGNLLESAHNKYRADEQAWHRYTYDKDNRLTQADFRPDLSRPWEEQARYEYYLHGPLKRTELAEDLQGIDYTYTTGGQLKSINHPSRNNYDPGKDSYTGAHIGFAKDVFGMTLDYYSGDYQRTGTHIAENQAMSGQQYYNGLIYAARWGLEGTDATGTQSMYTYQYDHLYQLTQAQFGLATPTLSGGVSTIGSSDITNNDDYKVWNLSYDLNGNIQSLNRNAFDDPGQSTRPLDQFTYHYASGLPNRLEWIGDAIGAPTAHQDLGDQSGTHSSGNPNYQYNEIGQLIKDRSRDMEIEYDAYGQVVKLIETTSSSTLVEFFYDEGGKRIRKVDHFYQNTTSDKTTWYVRDNSGTVMSIYTEISGGGSGTQSAFPSKKVQKALKAYVKALGGKAAAGLLEELSILEEVPEWQPQGLTQVEVPIYAAGRLGVYYRQSEQTLYELSDHLGNVRTVINRIKNSSGEAVVESHADFYPFGWTMPGRTGAGSNIYRYGYQGIEGDPETGWNAFTLRNYDPRMARWMNPDPMGQYYSPYLAMGNNPVLMVDPTGGFSINKEVISGLAQFVAGAGGAFLSGNWKPFDAVHQKGGGQFGRFFEPTYNWGNLLGRIIDNITSDPAEILRAPGILNVTGSTSAYEIYDQIGRVVEYVASIDGADGTFTVSQYFNFGSSPQSNPISVVKNNSQFHYALEFVNMLPSSEVSIKPEVIREENELWSDWMRATFISMRSKVENLGRRGAEGNSGASASVIGRNDVGIRFPTVGASGGGGSIDFLSDRSFGALNNLKSRYILLLNKGLERFYSTNRTPKDQRIFLEVLSPIEVRYYKKGKSIPSWIPNRLRP